jgi:hypothetical protein
VSFRDRLAPTYDEIVRIAPGKSIMIGEASSSEDGGSKADWISESSTTAQEAFADSIALPYYAANEFATLEGAHIRPPAPAASSGASSATGSP